MSKYKNNASVAILKEIEGDRIIVVVGTKHPSGAGSYSDQYYKFPEEDVQTFEESILGGLDASKLLPPMAAKDVMVDLTESRSHKAMTRSWYYVTVNYSAHHDKWFLNRWLPDTKSSAYVGEKGVTDPIEIDEPTAHNISELREKVCSIFDEYDSKSLYRKN